MLLPIIVGAIIAICIRSFILYIIVVASSFNANLANKPLISFFLYCLSIGTPTISSTIARPIVVILPL